MEWELLTKCHQLDDFGDHWHCDSGVLIIFIYGVTSQGNVIEGSCDFMPGSSLLYVTTLPNLEAISIMVFEICFFFSRDLATPRD